MSLTCFIYVRLASFFSSMLITYSQSLDGAIQNIIDTASHMSDHAGISLGLALPDRTVSLVTGYKNQKEQLKLLPTDTMGIGSGTKIFTATAALKLVEEGKIQLEDLALPHMDLLVRKVTSKSLLDFLGPDIANVTVRQLLHMTSGIGDFDSRAGRNELMMNPHLELDLNELLGRSLRVANLERTRLQQNKGEAFCFTCKPGTCGEYSSSNYLLLGMLLAQVNGAHHWSEYDQSSFLPAKVLKKMRLTLFPLQGPCSDFTDVHGYIRASGLENSPLRDGSVLDTHHMACNYGFTLQNALTTGGEMAIFLKALLGKNSEILDTKTIAEMLKLRWLETGLGNKVSVGQFYGMGMRDVSAQLNLNPLQNIANPEVFFSGVLLGHDGMSIGFNSFNAYAPLFDFSFSFIMNYDKAALFFNFISRKIYDIVSVSTKPVQNPIRATYENKDAFLEQKLFKFVKMVAPSGLTASRGS